MYKIIGADQKEYGPISADQIRQWISEGRVNGQTKVCAEGTQDWRPLETFPEFSYVSPVPIAPGGPPPSQEELLARDYSLDIGECVTKSWELVKANFWPVVGFTFLAFVVMNGINQLLGLISRPAMDAMIRAHQFSPAGAALIAGTTIAGMPFQMVVMGGLFRYYLKLIRGQNAGLSDVFSGFSNGFPQLALLGLIQGLLVMVGFVLCIIPGFYLSIAWYFAVVLVADQGMDFWSAMELSRKVVSRHWFTVFAFLLVMGLLAAAGIIGCCIGILVTMPISFIAIAYGYETVFGRKTA
jgi:hypothetical protein